MLWHISDTHWNHENILNFEPTRPDNYEDIIFRNMERLIQPDDELYHHGDFTFGGSAARKRVAARWKALKFKTHLILGNHDRHPLIEYYMNECGFSTVSPLFLIRDRVLLSHYPRASIGVDPKDDRYSKEIGLLAEIYKQHNCIMQVHGHTHSWCHPDKDTYMNISVENINYCPVSWDVIYAKAQANLI